MGLSGLLSYFAPKEKKFFGMFNQATANLNEGARELTKLLHCAEAEERKALTVKIKHIEKQGDKITQEVFQSLHQTFITPFDREDIHSLTNTIDDVLDGINSATGKIELYHCNTFGPHMKELALIIEKSCASLIVAVQGLGNMKDIETITTACNQVKMYEHEADNHYHMAISNLFDHETNAIELIRQKEIIQTLERTVNTIEDVTDVIKTIVIKYA